MSLYSDIIDLILSNKINSKEELHKYKIILCKKYKINDIPRDSEILANIPTDFSDDEIQSIIKILRKKPMRTISGVAIIAVMTSPESCPHGQCLPCPGGPTNETPQSYTGFEPAAMRGILNKFDPYLQTKNRLIQLKAIGHEINKIDFIIMGGTFTSRLPYYREWFVKRCYDALNNKTSESLYDAKKLNETAFSRCIGLTVETRPDWFRISQADQILDLGATRVELGVQSVFDKTLFKMKRGHSVMDTIYASRIAKDCGLKICYHMMPGLPGSNTSQDIESFKTIFQNPDFKPDMIKIYPTLVIEGTQLNELWKNGQYKPLKNIEASHLISKIKEFIPEWVRIQRIQRDVPAPYIKAGVDKSNLRQIVEKEMKDHNKFCKCIRCREIGHKLLKENIEPTDFSVKVEIIKYCSNESEEIFISLTDQINDGIIGYLRLRDILKSHRYELIKHPCMIIRELKIVGLEIPIGKKNKSSFQHKGFGKKLITEAERICYEEYDKKYLFVLSGVGVKPYYRNINFKDDGAYLYKKLT
jgi:elongator complex protein 3